MLIEAVDAPALDGAQGDCAARLDERGEGGEARVARVALPVAVVNLLDDGGDLEQPVGVVEDQRAEVFAAAAGARVSLGQLAPRQVSGERREAEAQTPPLL